MSNIKISTSLNDVTSKVENELEIKDLFSSLSGVRLKSNPLNGYAGLKVLVSQITGTGAEGLGKIIAQKLNGLDGLVVEHFVGKINSKNHKDWSAYLAEVIARSRSWMTKLDADITIWGDYNDSRNNVSLYFCNYPREKNGISSVNNEDCLELPLPIDSLGINAIYLALLCSGEAYYSSQKVFINSLLIKQIEALEQHLSKIPINYSRSHVSSIYGFLGIAYAKLASGSGSYFYKYSSNILEKANENFSRVESPKGWLLLQNRLAGVWSIIADIEGSDAYLKKSSAKWQEIASVIDSAVNPINWATAWLKASSCLQKLGRKNGEVASLRAALGAIEQALVIFEKDEYPVQWLESLSIKGSICMDMGALGSNLKIFYTAVECFKEILDFQILQNSTQYSQAVTYNNIGVAYFSMVRKNRNLVEECVEAEKYLTLAYEKFVNIDKLQQARKIYNNLLVLKEIKRNSIVE